MSTIARHVAAMRMPFVIALVLFISCKRQDTAEVSAAPPETKRVDSAAPATTFVVDNHGMGALRAGMTFKDALDSLKGALVLEPGANVAECSYATWRGAPPGVLVMADEGRVARIDIDSAGISTTEGAHVGMTEAQVLALYAGRAKVTPHAYSDGHYITVMPREPADSLFRIIFESENNVVTRYRVG